MIMIDMLNTNCIYFYFGCKGILHFIFISIITINVIQGTRVFSTG